MAKNVTNEKELGQATAFVNINVLDTKGKKYKLGFLALGREGADKKLQDLVAKIRAEGFDSDRFKKILVMDFVDMLNRESDADADIDY